MQQNYQIQAPVQQFVIINNQVVPVYKVSPHQANQQFTPNVIYQSVPYLVQQENNPQNEAFSPVQGTPVITTTDSPSQVSLSTLGEDEYTRNVVCYVTTYLILFTGCIGVQIRLYGSITAAALWITSYVLLIATLIGFFIVKRHTYTLALILQLSLLILSFIFEISAFTMALSHPILYNYQPNASPDQAVYNNRRLQQNYFNYDNCWSLYVNSSYSDYNYYYSQQCDFVLGFTNTTYYTDNQTCRDLYDYSYWIYELYYKSYCDQILGFTSGLNNYGSHYDFCYQIHNQYDQNTYREYYAFFCDPILDNVNESYYYNDDYYSKYYGENLCINDGMYDPYSKYCYPLQYGMLAYEIQMFQCIQYYLEFYQKELLPIINRSKKTRGLHRHHKSLNNSHQFQINRHKSYEFIILKNDKQIQYYSQFFFSCFINLIFLLLCNNHNTIKSTNNKYVSQVPGQQFVIINNQMVPVYTVSPAINMNPQNNPLPNVVFQPPPEQEVKQPQNVAYQPIQGLPIVPQVYSPPIAQVPTSGMDEYTHNVICYVVIYLILFVGCIGVQFGLYGSRTAAALWITSYVLLLVTMVWFYIVKQQTLIWLLLVQVILLILSFIFEIAAFAMAVSHPVLYDYQPNITPSNATYNDRRLQSDYYNYEYCKQKFTSSSLSDYNYYYSYQCNSILGFSNSPNADYTVCSEIYNLSSTYVYDIYYKSFCDPILGYSSEAQYYYSDYDFCYSAYNYDYATYQENYAFFCDQILGYSQYNYTDYDEDYYYDDYEYYSDNQCLRDGFYDPYRNYCYPLQYGMMAYAVLNLVAYLILFGILLKRIVVQIKILKENQKTGMAPQQQQLPQNYPQAF